jgi:hypothetical protein
MMQNNRIPPQNIFINLVERNWQDSIKTSFRLVTPPFVIPACSWRGSQLIKGIKSDPRLKRAGMTRCWLMLCC